MSSDVIQEFENCETYRKYTKERVKKHITKKGEGQSLCITYLLTPKEKTKVQYSTQREREEHIMEETEKDKDKKRNAHRRD